MKNRNTFAIGLVAAITLAGTSSSAAMATSPDSDSSVRVEVAMELTGFDAEVAAAHGFEIRSTASGRQFSVPVGTPDDFQPALKDTAPAPLPAGSISTKAAIKGDCGSSFVTVDNWTVTTGYTVSYGVLYSKWGVSVLSGAGTYQDFNLDHGSSGPIWDTARAINSNHSGWGSASVNGGSYALMTNGGTCYSGGPVERFYFNS